LNWWEGENRNQFIAGSPCSLVASSRRRVVASSRRRVVNVLRMISPESWVCHQPCGLGDAHSLRLNRESIVNRNGSFVNRYSA